MRTLWTAAFFCSLALCVIGFAATQGEPPPQPIPPTSLQWNVEITELIQTDDSVGIVVRWQPPLIEDRQVALESYHIAITEPGTALGTDLAEGTTNHPVVIITL